MERDTHPAELDQRARYSRRPLAKAGRAPQPPPCIQPLLQRGAPLPPPPTPHATSQGQCQRLPCQRVPETGVAGGVIIRGGEGRVGLAAWMGLWGWAGSGAGVRVGAVPLVTVGVGAGKGTGPGSDVEWRGGDLCGVQTCMGTESTMLRQGIQKPANGREHDAPLQKTGQQPGALCSDECRNRVRLTACCCESRVTCGHPTLPPQHAAG